MKTLVIIPARYASTRLPGKPIRPEIKTATGKFLIEHVYDQALRARNIHDVIVATDSPQIADAVRSFGGNVEMTSEKHQSGTDRIAEVAAKIPCDAVVNVQGDEPELHPEVIEQTVDLLASDPNASMSTMANPIEDEAELLSPNAVKVVVDQGGYALYFSRYTIPYIRDKAGKPSLADFRFLKHLGIYGYRREPFGVRACLSHDEGESWDVANELVLRADGINCDVGYPYAVQLPDGGIFAVYYLNQQDDRGPWSLIGGTFLRENA